MDADPFDRKHSSFPAFSHLLPFFFFAEVTDDVELLLPGEGEIEKLSIVLPHLALSFLLADLVRHSKLTEKEIYLQLTSFPFPGMPFCSI